MFMFLSKRKYFSYRRAAFFLRVPVYWLCGRKYFFVPTQQQCVMTHLAKLRTNTFKAHLHYVMTTCNSKLIAVCSLLIMGYNLSWGVLICYLITVINLPGLWYHMINSHSANLPLKSQEKGLPNSRLRAVGKNISIVYTVECKPYTEYTRYLVCCLDRKYCIVHTSR